MLKLNLDFEFWREHRVSVGCHIYYRLCPEMMEKRFWQKFLKTNIC